MLKNCHLVLLFIIFWSAVHAQNRRPYDGLLTIDAKLGQRVVTKFTLYNGEIFFKANSRIIGFKYLPTDMEKERQGSGIVVKSIGLKAVAKVITPLKSYAVPSESINYDVPGTSWMSLDESDSDIDLKLSYTFDILNEDEIFQLGDGSYCFDMIIAYNIVGKKEKTEDLEDLEDLVWSPNRKVIHVKVNVSGTTSPKFSFLSKELTLKVNNFDPFRNSMGLSGICFAGTIIHLHPLYLKMCVDDPCSRLFSSIEGNLDGISLNLNSMPGKFADAGSLARASNNKTTFYGFKFKVSSSDLNKKFIKAGNYNGNITLNAVSQKNFGLKNYTTSETLPVKIIVDDLTEMVINGHDVKFKFEALNNFSNGISIPMIDHLTISRTSSYDVNVRATAENMESGVNTIPVSILGIAPETGDEGVNMINAISTIDQLLINNGQPGVDKNYSLKYIISSVQARGLINKPAGLYTATLMYSVTAH